jgi:acyl carrier protein
MTDLRGRLTDCFAVVFPTLGPDEITRASMASVAGWDSLATVTLISVLEEEFAVQMSPDDLPGLASFELVLDYLRSQLDAH